MLLAADAALGGCSKRYDEIADLNKQNGNEEGGDPFDYTALVVDNHKRDWVQKPEEKLDLPAWVPP